MSSWMAFDPVWSPEWVWLRYATSLRATLVLAILAGAALLLRRAPASVRAGLWASALLAVLPLPAVRAIPLSWSAHVVPATLAAPMMSIGATMVAQSWPGALRLPWTSAVGIAWALGAAVVLGRLLGGWASVAALARTARTVRDPEWLAALGAARSAMGVRRRVRLLRAATAGTPLTWGTLRPVILLPADADAWSAQERRAVLLHELAHVRRLDCLLALLAQWTCATWWFHPGVWWAARRLELERERACDERVLLAGVPPSDYAECLLTIAERARAAGGSGPALVVAASLLRRSQLDQRIRTILDRRRAPRRPAGRVAPAMTAAAGLLLVAAAGTMRLAPRPAVLWTALGSPRWTTRAFAAENIARFGDVRSVAALDAALRDDPSPAVAAMARFGTRLRARSNRSRPPLGWPRSGTSSTSAAPTGR